MKAAHVTKIEELENQGWEFCKTATHGSYHRAGTTERMKSHDGYEYIRVFHGKMIFKNNIGYQVTTVMCRKE